MNILSYTQLRACKKYDKQTLEVSIEYRIVPHVVKTQEVSNDGTTEIRLATEYVHATGAKDSTLQTKIFQLIDKTRV